jgi:hypothetical protein
VDPLISAGRYNEAVQEIEKEKKQLYGSDAILYNLDKGMASHYSGDYKASNQLLETAQKEIEAAFTKSITQNIASYIVNDKTISYAGEDYEDIYLNAFNSLNYYHEDNLQDALVEIRRMDNKLQLLQTKYVKLAGELQKQNGNTEQYTNTKIKFNNSALARYLGMLFYRADGSADDARIERDWLKRAFNDESVYNFPMPVSVDEEPLSDDNTARLNVIAFSGLAPEKVQNTIRIPIMDTAWIKLALPEMKMYNSQVARVELAFENGTKYKLDLLEDMQAIALETFKLKQGLIKAKAIVRGTLKSATAVGLYAAADNANDSGAGVALWLGGIFAQIFAEASERADLRSSRYFPAKAYIAGVTLKAGTYNFSINYYNARGNIIGTFEHKNTTVALGELNLIEAYCLK